jgi:glycosyltransferase involved in cell wall biosynthesis|tara:strand:+ start:1334 stop:2551 length:1218 start_codon:yes stop_codon:yes gene_type:complete
MKITKLVIITHHFWPENFLINEIALKFEKKNIQSTVITGLPNYPKGEIFDKYKKLKTLKKENFRGLKIIRFPIIPRKKGKFINLVLNYFSYLINGIFFLRQANLKNKFHHIFVYSTSPITTALLGIYLKKKYKKKLTLWVQDLWPDSVKNTGFIKNKFFLYLISLIVKYIYKHSDNIVAQSKAFKKNIKRYTQKKIKVVENSHFNIENRKYKIPEKIKKILIKNFCVTFSGNIGKAQSIRTILEAAKQIKHYKKIHIILIGSGSEIELTKLFIKENQLKNISIFGPYPSGLAFKIIKKSNASLLTLKKSLIFSQTIPNKFQTYLFAKKPIIVSADGEVAKLTKKNKVGLVSNSENPKKLAANIIKISKFKSLQLKKIKNNCLNFYNKSYNINGQVKKLIKIMNDE